MYKDIKLHDIMIGNEDKLGLYRNIDDEIVKMNKCMDHIFINGLTDMHTSPRSYVVYRLEEMISYLKNYNKDVCSEIYKFIKTKNPKAVAFYNGALAVTYTTLKNELSTFIENIDGAIKTIDYYGIGRIYDISHILYEAKKNIYKQWKRS